MTVHRGTDNKERRMTLALVQSQAKTSWFGQQDISKNLPPQGYQVGQGSHLNL